MSSFFVVVVYCYLMMKFYLFSSEKMFLIKWLLSWKSLKQLFFIWLISCFILLGNSFVSAWYTRQVWSYWYNPYLQSFDINLTRSWNPLTSNLWYTKQIFVIQQNSSDFCAWFWNDWLPYSYCKMTSYFSQWNITSYQTCAEIIDIDSTSQPSSCISSAVWLNTKEVIRNFLSKLTNNDYYYFDYSRWWWWRWTFCISSHEIWKSFCFNFNTSNGFNNTLELETWLNFDSFPTSVLENPPSYISWWWDEWWNSWSWDLVWIALSSTGGAIDFYENRVWLNKDICYVGVNSMSILYWTSWISFNQGGGLTIFDAFQTLYWSTWLNEVYVWINNWLLNYEQWFWNDWNPMFLSNYNSWTNQVDIYYDNLTFPFANNPVAVYFMASYIEQVFANWLYNPSWSAVVSYCNLKINNWTFEEIIDNSDKVSINNYIEKENIYKWLNSDWTEKDYWAWLSSWVELAFSWDTSLKNSLKEFLDEAENNISSLKDISDSITWHILPVWIITPFVFFALFRFIRKH